MGDPAELRHPGIATELAGGEPLDRVVARATSVAERLALLPTLIAVADALAHAHAHRVIHRAVEPANVRIGEPGVTALIGWGHARDLDAPAPVIDKNETVVSGAPEPPKGDERDDVRGLGALLHLVLAGAPPPRPMPRAVPRELATIAGTATARGYANAGEVAAALRRFEAERLAARPRRGWPVAAMAGIAIAALAFALFRGGESSIPAVAVPHAGSDLVDARRALVVDPTRAIAELARVGAGVEPHEAAMIALDARQRGVASRVLTGLAHPAIAVAFSPDGGVVAATDADEVVVWETTSGRVRGTLRLEFPNTARGLAMSSDGSVVAVFGDADSVVVWQYDGNDASRLPSSADGISAFAFDHDGGHAFALGRNRVVYDWALATRDTVRIAHDVDALALSGDRTTLALATADGAVHLRAVAAPTIDVTVWKAVGKLASLTLRPDGGAVAVDTDGRVVRIGPDGVAHVDPEPGAAAVSPDGTIVARPSGNLVRWAPDRAIEVKDVRTVAFSPDSKWLLVVEAFPVVVSLDSGAVYDLHGHGSAVTGAFSADSRRLATSGKDDSVRIWELPTERTYAVEPKPHAIAMSPDGKTLAAVGPHGVSIIDTTTGARREAGNRPSGVAIDGGQIAFADAGAVLIVPAAGGDERALQTVEPGESLAFSHTGTRLAAGSSYGGVRIWDLASGEEHLFLSMKMPLTNPDDIIARRAVHEIAWSADDRHLVTISAGSVRVWNTATDESAEIVIDHEWATAAWLPGGSQLAIAARAQRVLTLWDADTRATRRIPFTGTVASNVAVSPDGTRVALAFDDLTIRVWDLTRPGDPTILLAGVVATSIAFHGDRIVERDVDYLHLWDVDSRTGAFLGDQAGDSIAQGGGAIVVGRGIYAIAVCPVDDVPVGLTTATIDATGTLTSSSSSPASGSSHR